MNIVFVDFIGYVGGKLHSNVGGGSEYLCLAKNPQWGNVVTGFQSKSYIYGTEYRTTTNSPFKTPGLTFHDVPCAVCDVTGKSRQLMIPAMMECPNGWTKEYNGYLMSAYYTYQTTSFICVDESPQMAEGGRGNVGGAYIYNVEAACGSLPCPHYKDGAELTCVVCTK